VPDSVALRRLWLLGTLTLSVVAFAATIALAPAGSAPPGRALQWLLFVGSSVHVAATGWFFTVPDVRRHARAHPGRYLIAPAALVATGVAGAVLLPSTVLNWLLLAFFGWQFFHFQKQNVGMAALSGWLRRGERRAIVATGVAGIAGLLAHPELLQVAVHTPVHWLFPVAGTAFAATVIAGFIVVARGPAPARPPGFFLVYGVSLLFFLPVFVFGSPYAAVAGMTVAHGYQYLLIVGLLAGGPAGRPAKALGLALLVNIALLGGLGLNLASHLHGGGPAARGVFGVYLGLLMAHFVVDAGLWRLRDEFPRAFLSARVPYLVKPAAVQPPQPPAALADGATSTTAANTAAVSSTSPASTMSGT
jgi:hypothetical protein